MDSLLSIVQMPGGIPVGTLAIGNSGAINAALLAASILASSGDYPEIDRNLEAFRKNQKEQVAETPVDTPQNLPQTSSNLAPPSLPPSINQPTVSQQILQHISQPKSFDEKLIPPGSTIGIVGGGQLAKMIIQAASQLGYKCHVYCPDRASPAFQIATKTTIADYTDKSALQSFAEQVDVVTYEFENIPAGTVEHLSQFVPVRPRVEVLAISQHRTKEKTFCQSIGVATTNFIEVKTPQDIASAIQQIGYPCILKSNTFGYDGKGQVLIKDKQDIEKCWRAVSDVKSDSGILEAFVNFSMEVSVIVARGFEEGSTKKQVIAYPVVENRHEHHILKETHVPAEISDDLRKQALNAAINIAENIGLVGLMAIEMFVTQGRILVNETAPRPHNSGHWTIEGANTSQFEQLVRAICGLPLGDPTPRAKKIVMKNLLGKEVLEWKNYLTNPRAHLHIYGKEEVREGRKMGHVTTLFND